MYTRNGLDLSHWNEIEEYGVFIDPAVLKQDSRQFKFGWVKAAEGEITYPEPGAYPPHVLKHQVECLRAAGVEEINPYAFYYYHVPWDEDDAGNTIYYVLDPVKQARALRAAILAAGFSLKDFKHPLADAEDPHIMKFLQWYDTESLNKAIAFARKLNAHFKKYLKEIETQIARPDIYSGAWWFDPWVGLLISQGYAAEVAWLNDYDFYIANYDNNGKLEPGEEPITPKGIERESIIAWQWTSTPADPVPAIPSSNNVDLAVWVNTEEKWLQWSGQTQGAEMSGTFEESVFQKDRASIVVLSQDEKRENMTEIAKYADLLTLCMGGADGEIGKGKELYYDSAFQIRAWRAEANNLPIAGLFTLSAAWHLWQEHEADKILSAPYTENKILKAILSQWRKIPLDYSHLSANDGNWYNLKYLVLFQYITHRPNGDAIPEPWFAHTLEYAVKFLAEFQRGGYIPDIPIYVLGTPAFFKNNQTHYCSKILNLFTALQIDGIGMSAPTTDLVPMAQPFPNMGEALKIKPPDTFKYDFVPYGLEEAIFFHIFTWGRLLSPEVTDALNQKMPYMVATWCNTKAEMHKTLKITGTTTPPPPPPTGTNPELETRVDNLEVQMGKVLGALRDIRDRLSSI